MTAVEIAKWVKDCEPLYESEYAGRMEQWCFFCGGYKEPRGVTKHDKDCVWLKAQTFKEAV